MQTQPQEIEDDDSPSPRRAEDIQIYTSIAGAMMVAAGRSMAATVLPAKPLMDRLLIEATDQLIAIGGRIM